LEDLLQFGVIDYVFRLDVHDFLTSLRVINLGLADAELGETTESGFENLDQAGIHVPDNASIVQCLNAHMKLAQQLGLFDGDACFLEATNGMGNHQVRVNNALQQVSQESEYILALATCGQCNLTILKVYFRKVSLLTHFQKLDDL
jgi:hypothetical protein